MATRAGTRGNPLRFIGVIRIIVALLGVFVLGVGAIVAWRADASTTLLIVGLALVFLAVIGDWKHLRLSHGEWAAEITRAATDQLDEASQGLEAAASELEVPDATRKEIEAVADELSTAARQLEAQLGIEQRSPHWLWNRVFGGSDEPVRPVLSVLLRDGQVMLGIAVPESIQLTEATCMVTDPTGRRSMAKASSSAQRRGTSFERYRQFIVTYPDDFGQRIELIDGEYLSRWRARHDERRMTIGDMVFTVPLSENRPEATDTTVASKETVLP